MPGDLVIGADSHTVTCGALNLFATGVGSSDLAAAMITGRVWLRVPETIRVRLRGHRPRLLAAKDVALAVIAELGAEGANYQTLEFDGPGVAQFTLEDEKHGIAAIPLLNNDRPLGNFFEFHELGKALQLFITHPGEDFHPTQSPWIDA